MATDNKQHEPPACSHLERDSLSTEVIRVLRIRIILDRREGNVFTVSCNHIVPVQGKNIAA